MILKNTFYFALLVIILMNAQIWALNNLKWFKGNLHTHSLWSDGNAYPEVIADWYQKHGYNFLCLSDHDILLQGQKWTDAMQDVHEKNGLEALEEYQALCGEQWVEVKKDEDKLMVRLKPLSEFRHLYEQSGQFLFIPTVEIGAYFQDSPVHVNAVNLHNLVSIQTGNNIFEVMENNIMAVFKQRHDTSQLMFPQLNHPNFFLTFPHDPNAHNWWANTAEDIAKLKDLKFFEVFNGSPSTYNYGDQDHISTDRIWDIMLTLRLNDHKYNIMYGTATDDAHQHHIFGNARCNPGLGWVMVRANHLTPEAIIKAMEAGDFYSSTGVAVNDIRHNETSIAIDIQTENNATYTTQFIGTCRGYDPTSNPIKNEQGDILTISKHYSSDIGKVLAEIKGTSPSYKFKGDELYVRAVITSSKAMPISFDHNPDMEKAWIQPVLVNYQPVTVNR